MAPPTPRPSGWYDDPNDEFLLRYFDGVIWTEHTANKRPTPPQDRVAAANPAGVEAGRSPSDQEQLRRRDVRGDRAAYARTLAGNGVGGGVAGGEPPLSGWWRRALAFLIDTFVVTLVCLPFTASRAAAISDQTSAWFSAAQRAASSGAAMPELPPDLVQAAMWVTIVQTVVYVLIEAVLLHRFGVTLGRLIVGIRVRLAAHDATPPFAVAFRRTVVKQVSNLLGGLPVISFLAWVFQVVDYLWPLRDRRNQALHDKVSDTLVVRGQPRPRTREKAPGDAVDRRR